MAFRIFVSIFLLFAITRIYAQWKRCNVTVYVLFFWLSVWSAVLVALYWPGLLEFVSDKVGIGRAVDLYVYLGIILSLYLIYRIYMKYEDLTHDITKLVRKQALTALADEHSARK